MDALMSGLINVGFGGIVVAALIWFLYYLVKETLPQQQRAFLDALNQERNQRTTDTGALLAKLDQLLAKLGRFQELTLDRIDFGVKELIQELMTARGERRPAGWMPPPESKGREADPK